MAAPHICFAGHTDVVPAGRGALDGTIRSAARSRDGVLYGRGACDMKGGIAAFVAAARRRICEAGLPRGSISLLITGDEEGAGHRRHRARAGLDGGATGRCRISAWSASRPARRGSAT